MIGQEPKDFAESIQPFFQHRVHGFKGRVPPGNTRSTVDDNGLHGVVGDTIRDPSPDLCRLVFDEMIGCDRVTALLQQFLDQLAAGVGLWRARIAAGDDHAADGAGGVVFVFFVAWGAHSKRGISGQPSAVSSGNSRGSKG
ncbi:hypothetical protein NSPZN2_40020 [Nitrospira defluvii]|uniref:Uncharacterized protein n=1 Tax=Nitrospira defluvii TaxID=330214 RepID=A0ABM8RQ17_9BACT|nr:hypothetical protein NSPZN2_40020 [Nitrospira defluvii]